MKAREPVVGRDLLTISIYSDSATPLRHTTHTGLSTLSLRWSWTEDIEVGAVSMVSLEKREAGRGGRAEELLKNEWPLWVLLLLMGVAGEVVAEVWTLRVLRGE